MKKVKNVLIFLIINIIILGIIVGIPLLSAYKLRKNHPNSIIKSMEGVELPNFDYIESFKMITQNQPLEERTAFANILAYWCKRFEYSYANEGKLYLTFGLIIAIAIITIGILLKYKSKNKVYSLAFITAGILAIIYYLIVFRYWAWIL